MGLLVNACVVATTQVFLPVDIIGRDLDTLNSIRNEDACDSRIKVKNNVRRLVNFCLQNLMESYSLLGKFDIISC